MKKIIILILIVSSSSIFGQSLSELNKAIGLTDSLTNEKEIRIYKYFQEQNHKGIFRMYQDSSKIWRAELIDYNTKVPTQFKVQKHNLRPKSDMGLDLVWFNILKTHIQDLPNMSDIRWKLQKPTIQEINGEKELLWMEILRSGGEGFEVHFRLWKKSNRVFYSNPESLLEEYENVDELIYFNQLLNVLRTEFGVWENE